MFLYLFFQNYLGQKFFESRVTVSNLQDAHNALERYLDDAQDYFNICTKPMQTLDPVVICDDKQIEKSLYNYIQTL
jgi:hypothetical protein